MANLFKNLVSYIQEKAIGLAPDSRILVEAAMRRGNGSNGYAPKMNVDPVNIMAKTMKDYKHCIMQATDRENPQRGELMRFNDNMTLDNHMMSLIESRILFSQRSAFKMVSNSGEENKDLSWLLERSWFDTLIYKVLFEQFQGTTLLGLFDLTNDGELDNIMEIPQSHFNVAKGIIVENEGDLQGSNYKEGPLRNYVIQIGEDYDLGMFEKLAPILLAKKLAIGSNLDYIEKFGVPPLFITTDREDDGRLKELYEAALNFKSNHFMVGRGQEKFEVGKDAGGGSTAPFQELINFVNDEEAKRILGGNGITDEKSFVGSAEIQFKLAKDRFESDKLRFKYIFNKEIKPRLVKLSPVYAGFADHYFEWDDTETLSKSEIVDICVKLGSMYEVDPQYVTEQTGVPILGMKYGTTPNEEPGAKK